VVNRPNVFLIDATSLSIGGERGGVFRGAPPFVNSKGEDNTFVYGFLRDLLRLRSAYGIEKAVVVGSEAINAASVWPPYRFTLGGGCRFQG
jgi:hypothetical protein